MSQIYGDWEGSYNELPRWLNTIQCYAPGTIVRYATSRHEDNSSLILDKIFWAFKPCIEGFGFCKLILQVDGTFLTGKYTVTLLIASSQDGNRRIFHVKEKLKKHENDFSTMFILTCLLGALRTKLPQWCNAQSVYCICHVASNFNKEFKDGDLKEKVIQMRYELMRPRFEPMLGALHQKKSKSSSFVRQHPKRKMDAII
ncbi:hypothetical protein Lal_00036985 [Lupinus albus]|nr:hypothetical protein Lal_00036985 [Lupinus albus]